MKLFSILNPNPSPVADGDDIMRTQMRGQRVIIGLTQLSSLSHAAVHMPVYVGRDRSFYHNGANTHGLRHRTAPKKPCFSPWLHTSLQVELGLGAKLLQTAICLSTCILLAKPIIKEVTKVRKTKTRRISPMKKNLVEKSTLLHI